MSHLESIDQPTIGKNKLKNTSQMLIFPRETMHFGATPLTPPRSLKNAAFPDGNWRDCETYDHRAAARVDPQEIHRI